jgi:hypothetical protein
VEAAGTSICLVMKAVLLSARWAGRTRRLGLEQAAKASGDGAEVQAENAILRAGVKWRWDTPERILSLCAGEDHSTIWDLWVAPPGAVPFSGA